MIFNWSSTSHRPQAEPGPAPPQQYDLTFGNPQSDTLYAGSEVFLLDASISKRTLLNFPHGILIKFFEEVLLLSSLISFVETINTTWSCLSKYTLWITHANCSPSSVSIIVVGVNNGWLFLKHNLDH